MPERREKMAIQKATQLNFLSPKYHVCVGPLREVVQFEFENGRIKLSDQCQCLAKATPSTYNRSGLDNGPQSADLRASRLSKRA